MSRLRIIMERHQLTLPRDEPGLLNQITSQESHQTLNGNLTFNHPEASHDDQLWALALAAYSTSQNKPAIFTGLGARRQR